MMRRSSLLLSSILALAGCQVLGPQAVPPTNTYALSIPNVHSSTHHENKITLLVNTPTAAPGYDTSKMMYTNKLFQVSSFAQNKWAAAPAEMIGPLLVEKLRQTNKFHAVISSAFTADRQFILRTHVTELRQNFTVNPSKIELTITAELINAENNKVMNTRTFTTALSTPENTPYGGVLAANRAVNKVLTQISEFCVDSLKLKKKGRI